MIDDADKDLEPPRAAEWTYSLGFNHDWILSGGSNVAFRASYAYRDESFYTDNNLGYLLEQDILNAGIDFMTASDRWVFSLYGKNLLNSVNHGNDTQLPAAIQSDAEGLASHKTREKAKAGPGVAAVQ